MVQTVAYKNIAVKHRPDKDFKGFWITINNKDKQGPIDSQAHSNRRQDNMKSNQQCYKRTFI